MAVERKGAVQQGAERKIEFERRMEDITRNLSFVFTNPELDYFQDPLDPASYKHDDERRGVEGVREFVREFPQEVYTQREMFPKWLQWSIGVEAMGQLVVEDEERAFAFFEEQFDPQGYVQTNTVEQNLRFAKAVLSRDVAPRVLLDDTDKGVDFYRRRVLLRVQGDVRDERLQLANELMDISTDKAEKFPERALDIFQTCEEIAGGESDDQLERAKLRFYRKTSEALLSLDPERALKIFTLWVHGTFDRQVMRDIMLGKFRERMEVAKVRLLVQSGDIIAAAEQKERLVYSDQEVYAEINGLASLLKQKALEILNGKITLDYNGVSDDEVVEYSLAKAFVQTLPDTFPGFAEVCKQLKEMVLEEAKVEFRLVGAKRWEGQSLADYREQKGQKIQEIFWGMIEGVPELGFVEIKENTWTPEQFLLMANQLVLRPEVRQGILGRFQLDELPDDDEFRGSPQYDQIRRLVFEVQYKNLGKYWGNNWKLITEFMENIHEFGDLIQGIDEGDRNRVIGEVTRRNSLQIIRAMDGGLVLNGDQLSKIKPEFEKHAGAVDVILDGQAQVYLRLVGSTPEEVLGAIAERYPVVMRNACERRSTKNADFMLSDVVRGKLMNALVSVDPVGFLGDASMSKVPEGHVFSPKNVHNGMSLLLGSSREIGMRQLAQLSDRTGIEMNWKAISETVSKRAVESMVTLERYVQEYPEIASYLPWGRVPSKLEKLQAHAANREHDPWITDLQPLVEALMKKDVLRLERVEDGEALVRFVAEFGMINAPNLAEIVIGLQRKDGVSMLSRGQKDQLVELIMLDVQRREGIAQEKGERPVDVLDPTRKQLEKALRRLVESSDEETAAEAGELLFQLEHVDSQGWRSVVAFVMSKEQTKQARWLYQVDRLSRLTPELLLNVLSETRKACVGGFLEDSGVPVELQTGLGQEIFAAAVGTGRWVKSGALRDMIKLWEKTIAESPDRGMLPTGYQEEVIEVAVKMRGDADEEERKDKEVKKTLQSQPLLEYMSVLAKSVDVDEGGGLGFDESLLRMLENFERSLIDTMEKQESRVLKLTGVAAEKLGQRIAQLREQIGTYSKIRSEMEQIDADPQFITRMEQLVSLGGKGPEFEGLLIALSLRHISQSNQTEHHNPFKDSEQITERMVIKTAEFIEQYLMEHYLHPEQVDHYVGHEPFSPELLAALRKAWKVGRTEKIGEEDISRNPILRAKQEIRKVRGPGELSEKNISVAMVPGEGLPKIMSGDTGNACYTSRHDELARGLYPDMHAFTYVLGRDTAQERFAGSVLFVEGRMANNKTPVLLVRANNPRENLIQSIENESFVFQSLEKAIETAERRGIGVVLVPLDYATQSSSNRKGVSEVYWKYFSHHKKTELRATPEAQFNGYNNWNAAGDNPSVIIWTKEDGKIRWPETYA